MAQTVGLCYRVERWDRRSWGGSAGQQGVGEVPQQQAEGEARRTKRTDSHMAKPDVGMGCSPA